MERLAKKLDTGSINKLKAHLVNDISLWDLTDDDLKEMDIVEKGPRKIITRFIERHAAPNDDLENSADNEQDESLVENHNETLRSVLEKHAKFQMTLTRLLDYGLVPDVKKLRLMNRILVDHYFAESILKHKRYPTCEEKQRLARRILEEFPDLAETRITETAPQESNFFWRHGGEEHGPHTGLIENRVSNIRKDVLPENRKFRRTKKEKVVVIEENIQVASRLAALMPTVANARTISEGMASASSLHKQLLQKKTNCMGIIEKFPHLLEYDGEMIIQAFDRLQKSSGTGDIKKLLRAGLLFDESIWYDVEDEYLRGALRTMKKLSNRGIKRTTTMEHMTTDEILAAPLVRWVQFTHSDVGYDELLAVKELVAAGVAEPHIVCVASRYKRGNYYVVFEEFVVKCGPSSVRAIEILHKSFAVFALTVPVLLRKFDDMLCVNVFGTKQSSKKISVNHLTARYKEHSAPNE